MKKGIEFSSEGELPFNDKNHLTNHLNYLFRTDKNQKWTNELTKYNYFIVLKESKSKVDLFGDDLDEKIKLKEELRDYLNTKELEHLRMILFEITSDLEGVSGEELFKEIVELFRKTINGFVGVMPIVMVAHFDQTDFPPHVHLVFLNKGEYSLLEILED